MVSASVSGLKLQSNLAIKNFLVALKLFLNDKSSLSLWSKWQIGHWKWFVNTNLFLIKPFLIAKFDCIYVKQPKKSLPLKMNSDKNRNISGFSENWCAWTAVKYDKRNKLGTSWKNIGFHNVTKTFYNLMHENFFQIFLLLV